MALALLVHALLAEPTLVIYNAARSWLTGTAKVAPRSFVEIVPGRIDHSSAVMLPVGLR